MILIRKEEGYSFVPLIKQKDIENYYLHIK
jgi:hypothetical protein